MAMSAVANVLTFTHRARITDFEQFGAVFSGWRGRIEQISSGTFLGDLRIVHATSIRIVQASGNQRLRVVGRDASNALAIYPLNASLAAGSWSGRQHSPGQIVVDGADEGIDLCSGRTFSGSAVFVSPTVLAESIHWLSGADHDPMAPKPAVHSPAAPVFAEMQRQLARLLEWSADGESALGTPEGHRLEQECLRALVAAIVSDANTADELPRQARQNLAIRAEEIMRARLGDHLGMIDLCRQTGANDRTLRLAFRERYGMGPMTYFRFLRLNAVRSRLRSNRHGSVADAARQFGFHHLGNFASDYRRHFGERPSDTRRM